jgi:hypothetical protein
MSRRKHRQPWARRRAVLESGEAPDARTDWLPKVSRREVIGFAIWVAVLLGPWPGYGRAFTAFFSGYANFVVAVFHLGGDTPPRFATATATERANPEIGDWSVMLSPPSGAAAVPLETRILGYTPLALLLALVLATATPPRRRLKILALASALLLARLAVGVALPVARMLGALRAESTLGPAAEVVWWAFIATPAMSYAAPLLAWGVALIATTPKTAAPISENRKKFRKSNALA